ncbi:MAG: NADPH-dependent F420 reductase [Acidimicrobiales bacterium]
MRIAVLGTGHVGQALGRTWTAKGHNVVLGSRRPAQVDCSFGQADSLAGAAARSEVVVLAVPFAAVPDTVAAAGDLEGKVVVDATNPVGVAIPAPHHSGAELVASLVPTARVVKSFNTMGWETMANPLLEGRRALNLMCGDDAGAKASVLTLSEDLGFDTVDAGDLSAAHLLEAAAQLWIHLAFRAGLGRDVAFALLRRAAG